MENNPNPKRPKQERDKVTSDKTLPDRKRGTPAVSAVLPEGQLVEMVFDPVEQRTRFVLWQNGAWRFEQVVRAPAGERLIPYSAHNNLIKKEVVLFPSGPCDYGSETELVRDIQSFIHRYVDVSPRFERIASYYVLFSWLYDGFAELPYLRLRGDYGSGKTRFLLTVGSLCYKPIFASGATSTSAIFRMLDCFGGTLIIDEGDFRYSDEKSDLIKIFNNGKSALLFNYHRVVGAQHLVIVEGYWSVFRLHALNVPAVALMGTSLSDPQMDLLRQSGARRFTLLLDADQAGRKAMAYLLPRLASLFFVHTPALPDNESPDIVAEDLLLEAVRL
jgi:hypothetical protein